MKFGTLFSRTKVAEWAEFYLNYEILKKLLSPYKTLTKKYVKVLLPNDQVSLTNFTAQDLENIHKFANYFELLIFHEFRKIGLFFLLKLNESYKKWRILKLNALIILQTKESSVYIHNKYMIKEAYHIFYKELKLLLDFFQINMEALKKITKKHKKFVPPIDPQNDLRIRYEKLLKESKIQHQKDRLVSIVQLVEADYLEYFYKKYNRKEGLQELRKINQGKLISQKESFQFGLFAGFSLILIFLIIILIWNENLSADDQKFGFGFPLFRGIGIIIAYIWLLAWNVYGWTKYNVNYKLIFKFNYHYSQISEILKRAAFFTTIFLTMFLWYLILLSDFHEDKLTMILRVVPKEFTPLFVWLCFLGYIFFPLKTVFNPLGRIYTYNLLVEILKTPFVKVTFAISWATDQLASFVVPLKDFEYLICFYTSNYHDPAQLNECNSKDRFSSAILMAFIPLLLRIFQCGRQIYDNGKIISPFFFNAIKYLASIIVVVFSYLATNHPEHKYLMAIWILFAFISTIYSYYWDLKYDWGFLDKKSKYKFLRSTLSYNWPTIYYLAMIVNLLLRMAWVFSISPDIVRNFIRPELFTFIIGFMEIFRRSIWNFLRVEKEHIHNCGVFKAVDDVKLPYDDFVFRVDQNHIFKNETAHYQEKEEESEISMRVYGDKDYIDTFKKPTNINNTYNTPNSPSRDKKYSNESTNLREPLISNRFGQEFEMKPIGSIESNLDKLESGENFRLNADLRDLRMIRKGSKIDISKEDLVRATKNPFPFDEWLHEIREFKKNIIERYCSKFKVIPMYYDLNIRYSSSKPHINKEFLENCLEDGYSGIAFNFELNANLTQKDACNLKPFDIASIIKTNEKLTNASTKSKLITNFKQLSRITLILNDPKYLQILTDTNLVLKTYDIVAVKTSNQKIFYSLCLENDVVDIITFDLTEKLPFQLKRGPITEAIKKGIMFEISYANAFEDQSLRRMIFSNAMQIINSTKQKNILFTSNCEDPFYHRSPHDILMIGSILGLKKEMAAKCISDNALRCIKRGGFRKNFKGTVSFATLEEEALFMEKKLNFESKKKVKVNPNMEIEKNPDDIKEKPSEDKQEEQKTNSIQNISQGIKSMLSESS